MARPSSAPEAEATARVYRLFAAYSVKDIVGENFRSHALLVNTANTDATIGQHRHQRKRAGEIPAVPHNALSAIAVRGIVPARNHQLRIDHEQYQVASALKQATRDLDHLLRP